MTMLRTEMMSSPSLSEVKYTFSRKTMMVGTREQQEDTLGFSLETMSKGLDLENKLIKINFCVSSVIPELL